MVPLPPPRPLAVTTLGVRWLHVLAATVAVGGGVLTWLRFRVEPFDGEGRDAVRLARAYEWLFWAAVGTLVMTGVGNLGAFAPTLPGGAWRTTLDAKLALVVVVLVGSAVRTRLLVRVRRSAGGVPMRLLRRAYGATALGLVALLTLAEVLAHG
ncbi:hypothetical protein [Salinigranum halophilum]|jgi:uncharacterized membrane protein|uniref:hypothetical protein n=1 Tax=Salinigranum halophilum TaxID=2565931 RepID=UPI0010A7F210|nr:hypothetical protein [Salinigranum halophilum]